jgi:hypothetical protein
MFARVVTTVVGCARVCEGGLTGAWKRGRGESRDPSWSLALRAVAAAHVRRMRHDLFPSFYRMQVLVSLSLPLNTKSKQPIMAL